MTMSSPSGANVGTVVENGWEDGEAVPEGTGAGRSENL
jgi:hypothetical protein